MVRNIIAAVMIWLNIAAIAAELDPDRIYTVAFAQDTLDNDYRYNQVKVVEETLRRYPNIRFLVSDGKANAALQIAQIEEYTQQRIDLLMTSPYDETATTEAVAKAYRAGIPVILVDRTVKGDEYTTYIHPDNTMIARQAAEYLAKTINYKGRVLLLKGVPKADVTRKRTEGFYQVISKYPQIKVVERTANYLRRDAIIEMEKLLSDNEHFDAIMSQSDSMLVGARMVLGVHGIDPSTLVSVGIDYIKPAQKAIRSGRQNSSFIYSLCAKESADAAVRILAGEKVPKEIKIETVQVTKENVDVVEPIF